MPFFPIDETLNLVPGYRKAIFLEGRSLLLFQPEEDPYLIKNQCPHMDIALSDAEISSDELRCRAHGIAFELGDGKAIGPLTDVLPCLEFYPVVYEGRFIGVELD